MSSSSRHSRHGRPAPAGRRGIGWLLLGFGSVLSLLALAIVLVTAGSAGHDHGVRAGSGTSAGEASQPLPTPARSTSADRSLLPSSPAGSASTSSSSASGTRAAQPVPASATPVPQPVVSPAGGAAGTGLPVPAFTGSASQLITVLAPSASSTTAIVQAWTRQGAGWVRHGASMSGEVGAAGLTWHPSEQTPATPIGSFTLTQAFGAQPDPGTALPYLKTTPGDWWISQPGPLYNTQQRCSAHCPFTQGAPNEHLRYLTPAYDYAVVIDYNTANAGPIRQGAGSAFFLHVSDGRPTAGCVSIPEDRLIALLQWLKPTAHPRILIGIGAG